MFSNTVSKYTFCFLYNACAWPALRYEVLWLGPERRLRAGGGLFLVRWTSKKFSLSIQSSPGNGLSTKYHAVHQCTDCNTYDKNVTISWQMQYIKISDLSLGWLVGRSGHCTVSGPSGDGVSGAPSSLCDSPACCSSLRGCSSIQLANTSIVCESRSPATSGRDHREVELSEFKKKKWIMECCFC